MSESRLCGQMRRGMERVIRIDADAGIITRGGETHRVICRVSYQSGGVWGWMKVDAGMNISTTPYVLAEYNADIQERDVLQWRNRRFQVGVVSFPTLGGGAVCLQAQLREVGNEQNGH